jgi:hypothetical protein
MKHSMKLGLSPSFETAFLKRRSQVRILPGTPLFSKDLVVSTSPEGPSSGLKRGVSGTKTVHGRGAS